VRPNDALVPRVAATGGEVQLPRETSIYIRGGEGMEGRGWKGGDGREGGREEKKKRVKKLKFWEERWGGVGCSPSIEVSLLSRLANISSSSKENASSWVESQRNVRCAERRRCDGVSSGEWRVFEWRVFESLARIYFSSSSTPPRSAPPRHSAPLHHSAPLRLAAHSLTCQFVKVVHVMNP